MTERLTHLQSTTQDNDKETSPLHVVAFTDLCASRNQANILTLPGGALMQGRHSQDTPIEHSANSITREHNIITKAHARLWSGHEDVLPAQGFSVRLVAPRLSQLELANYAEGMLPINHELDLELHDYHNLLEQVEADEERHIDAVYLRSFGRFAFKNL